ncbi:MAG: type II toxin-antitoxin system RelE/ParE family toxin, partial [Candidatus Methanofastidiosia archaeon]
KTHPLFEKDIRKLTKLERKRLSRILSKIKENPTRYRKLKKFKNCYRVRIGNLRVVYILKGEIIWIVIVGKREKVYREMKKRIDK